MTTGSDDGQRAQALLEKGAGLYEEGKLYEAISCWRQVLAIDPDNEIAAEYLRFIEDNFQIGIDTFLEHHRENPSGAFDGPEDDLAAAIDDSINALLDESIEELDWTELLDEPLEESAPPPPGEIELDEAFFAELDVGSLQAEAGAEAEAWGRSLLSPTAGMPSSGPSAMPGGSIEMMPEGDPFTLPVEHFAADYAPGEFEAETEAAPALDRPVTGPPADQRQRPDRTRRKDLADMSDDSIDSLLDEDFKAWDSGEDDEAPADSYELPFDRPGSNPPRAATPDARPSQPSLGAGGAPVERRRRPALEGQPLHTPDPRLGRHTGPMEAVGPRLRDELGGVQRVSRTTPPTPVHLPPEAMPEDEPRPSEPRPPEPRPPEAPTLETPAPQATVRNSQPPRGIPKQRIDGAPEERRQAADSIERVEAVQAAEPYRPPTQDPAEAPAETDLDDDLRALLTAGIAEIEAVERPVQKPRRLIEAPPPGTNLDGLMVEARRRQQADDFTGALALVEQVLAAAPDHAEARRYLEANTDRLLAMYRARLGSLGRIPRVKLRQQEIVWQSLDHREGFILSQVDGRTSFEEIIDISGMPQLEASRILARLVDHGVIG